MVTTLMYVIYVTSMKILLWFLKLLSSILILLIFQISMVTTLKYVIYVTSMKIHHWFLKLLSSILILLLPTVKQVSIRGSYMSAHVLLNLLSELGKRDNHEIKGYVEHFFAFSQLG